MTATLEQLENQVWDDTEFNSHLVVTCHALRRKAIDQFAVEDLRIMIGQNIGLRHLMPLALDVLRENPFAEGDYYPGDLLKNVISADRDFFQDNPDFTAELTSICRSAIEQIEMQQVELYSLEDDMQQWLLDFIETTADV